MSRSNPRVLSTLERAGGFASAQEVYRLMQREGESIGLTTVYRSLQSLVNDKVVDVLRREDGEAIYRLCGEAHHHHLVCKGCGDTVVGCLAHQPFEFRHFGVENPGRGFPFVRRMHIGGSGVD